MAWRFRNADVTRHSCVEDPVAEMVARVLFNKPDRLLRRSNIVSRMPERRSRALKRRRTASIVCIRLLMPSSAKNSHCNGTITP